MLVQGSARVRHHGCSVCTLTPLSVVFVTRCWDGMGGKRPACSPNIRYHDRRRDSDVGRGHRLMLYNIPSGCEDQTVGRRASEGVSIGNVVLHLHQRIRETGG